MLGLTLKTLAVAAMIALPVLGVWVASSLAALRHGPVWLTLLAGLLLCPVLPLSWELRSAWRRSKRAKVAARILSLSDRMILRTLALNVVFLTALLAAKPSAAFTALSARGDWMLDGRYDARAKSARAGLFAAAAKLEWLYLAAHDNPFKKSTPEPEPTPTQTPTPSPGSSPSSTSLATPSPSSSPSSTSLPTPTSTPPEQANPPSAPQAPSWPVAKALDPNVAAMPASAETTIQSVADYIGERVPAPFARLKAVHDWVADRVAYDAESYLAGRYPPQDANTVFRTRTSVCAGYANLLEALGRAAGLEVRYLTGDARTQGSDLDGQSHAWNAARVDGKWYLIDPTWDSGVVDGRHFKKRYSTEYFLTPPRVFNLDHLPDDAQWQLLDKPLSRGEFLRQPAMAPLFFARGLVLLSPDRSQVDVRGSLDIRLENPEHVFLLATYQPRDQPALDADCDVDDGNATHIVCRFSRPGSYDVKLYSNREAVGTFEFTGQLQANAN